MVRHRLPPLAEGQGHAQTHWQGRKQGRPPPPAPEDLTKAETENDRKPGDFATDLERVAKYLNQVSFNHTLSTTTAPVFPLTSKGKLSARRTQDEKNTKRLLNIIQRTKSFNTSASLAKTLASNARLRAKQRMTLGDVGASVDGLKED